MCLKHYCLELLSVSTKTKDSCSLNKISSFVKLFCYPKNNRTIIIIIWEVTSEPNENGCTITGIFHLGKAGRRGPQWPCLPGTGQTRHFRRAQNILSVSRIPYSTPQFSKGRKKSSCSESAIIRVHCVSFLCDPMNAGLGIFFASQHLNYVMVSHDPRMNADGNDQVQVEIIQEVASATSWGQTFEAFEVFGVWGVFILTLWSDTTYTSMFKNSLLQKHPS